MQKSHSGAKKRFKVTGSGRVKARKTGRQHNFAHKSGSRLRRLKKGNVLKSDVQNDKIRNLIS